MSLTPYWSAEDIELHLGDCLAVLAGMEAESVDAVICDPPYGLSELPTATVMQAIGAWMSGDRAHVPGGRGFMGSEWDRFVPPPAAWDECMRVLKPGGWLLAFAGTRTADLMTLAIRMAGFEIRDSIHWITSSGFPKGHNVSRAIDREAGAQREVISEGATVRRMIPGADQNRTGSWIKDNGREFTPAVTAPATPEAAEWEGWDVALKPAHEPIIVARKKLAGTVAQNVLAYGTGALNIDATRVGAGQDYRDKCASVVGLDSNRNGDAYREWTGTRADSAHAAGRWPSNVLFTHSASCQLAGTRIMRGDGRAGQKPGQRDGGFFDIGAATGEAAPNGPMYGDAEQEVWNCAENCPVAELDRQSAGTRASKPSKTGSSGSDGGSVYGNGDGLPRDYPVISRDDAGGASRFFRQFSYSPGEVEECLPVFRYEAKAGARERPRLPDGTAWPTVKPLELMRWLARLVTPPRGLILDPFCGTGTTAHAAIAEGFRCTLIEQDPVAAELAKVRLTKPIQPGLFGLEAM